MFSSAPVTFKGQHLVNLALAILMIVAGIMFVNEMPADQWPAFLAMTAIAFLLGVLIIIPIGGADMPVVISMLNSYSRWAAAGIGFSLDDSMLIIAGSLVGSSGAILSYSCCRAGSTGRSSASSWAASEARKARWPPATRESRSNPDRPKMPHSFWRTPTAWSSCRGMGWPLDGRSMR